MQNKRAWSVSTFVLRACGNTGHYILYSGITKIYCRKPVGHVFTKPEPLGICQSRVFVPPLLRDFADLKARIIAAVKNIDAPMLTRVWQQLEYRVGVCRVTCGAHIEQL
jgi:hypothetical protein